MNRRTQIIAAVSAALVVAVFYLLRPSYQKIVGVEADAPPPNKAPARIRVPAAPGAVATRPLDPQDLQQVSSHPLAISFGANPELTSSEPGILLEILRFYRMEFGSFPAGQENSDIMNALTGNNPGKLPVFPRKHPRIDSAGRLLDAWGSPFVFHPISSQHLEIRSKGPDGEIFSPDDIVAGKQPVPDR